MATGMLDVCPRLIPQNIDRTVYEGFITASGCDFHVHLQLGEGGTLRGAQLECEWKLKHLLRGYEHIIKQRLEQSSSLTAFMVEFKSILERQVEKEQKQTPTPPPQFYSRLIAEIEELGWERLVYIDPGFSQLHLQATDKTNRNHILQVQLREYPVEAPVCLADLPQRFDLHWKPQSTLKDVLSQFRERLVVYQEFWDMLDGIDANTWVLEPEKPTRSATKRRIALGSSASVQIEVDPGHPRLLPECRFLGADHVVNPLRENLNSSIQDWNSQESLLTNLQKLLGITFPSPANTKKEDFNVECGICYAYRLEEQIPDKVCDDARCGQPFHHECLYEWLRSLSSSRQSFNTIFGECPYCSKPITVKMPTR